MTPDADPATDRLGSPEPEPPLDALEADLARSRAELRRYRELMADLPSIYEEKFRYERQVLGRELRWLVEEQEQLRNQLLQALKSAAQRASLPPAAANEPSPVTAGKPTRRNGRRRRLLRRHLSAWKRRVKRADLPGRFSSWVQRLEARQDRLRRKLRLLELQMHRRQRAQERSAAAAISNPAPAQVSPVALSVASPPKPGSAASTRIGVPASVNEGTLPEETLQKPLPQLVAASDPERAQRAFRSALNELLMKAPPARYRKARELYFRKHSLEDIACGSYPLQDRSGFSTFVRMDAHHDDGQSSVEPTEASGHQLTVLEFSLIHWAEDFRGLSELAHYLESRWGLDPSHLEQRRDAWLDGKGNGADFKLRPDQ
ncbi:MAG: hypothetical protein WBN89_00095 [Prochlorococcaceae cyanobacterium]